MEPPHISPRETLATRRVGQIVAAVLALAGAGLATATVLARPAPGAPRPSVQVTPTLSVHDSADRFASSGEDNGPGCDEAAVAKHP